MIRKFPVPGRCLPATAPRAAAVSLMFALGALLPGRAATSGTHEVALAWTDGSDNESHFRVERRGRDGAYQLVGTVPGASGRGGTIVFRDHGLMALASVAYRVRAENAAGVSGWSNEVACTVATTVPVAISTQPVRAAAATGSAASFTVLATGEEVSYQWLRDGRVLYGETSQTLYLPRAMPQDAGEYSVRVFNPVSAVESAVGALEVRPGGTARLVNISTRALAGTGVAQLVPGVTISGEGDKVLLVRAVGPKLADFNVTGTLADPRLDVYSGGSRVAGNDDWVAAPDAALLESTRVAVQAFPLAPSTKDAALLAACRPNVGYTFPVSGVDSRTGLALVEMYDTAPASASRISNLSVRAMSGVDGNVLMAGFVVSGDVGIPLLIRGVGPALRGFGVDGALQTPVLTVYRMEGGTPVPVATNSGWEQGAKRDDMADAVARTGAFPLPAGSADAALLLALPPGTYSVQVAGEGRTTGVALIEVYVVP